MGFSILSTFTEASIQNELINRKYFEIMHIYKQIGNEMAEKL